MLIIKKGILLNYFHFIHYICMLIIKKGILLNYFHFIHYIYMLIIKKSILLNYFHINMHIIYLCIFVILLLYLFKNIIIRYFHTTGGFTETIFPLHNFEELGICAINSGIHLLWESTSVRDQICRMNIR